MSASTWTGSDGPALLYHVLAAVSNDPEENRKRSESILLYPNQPDKWYRQECTDADRDGAFLCSIQTKYPPQWYEPANIWHVDRFHDTDCFQTLLKDTVESLQHEHGEMSDENSTPQSTCGTTGPSRQAKASFDCVQNIESTTDARCVVALTFGRGKDKSDHSRAKVSFCKHLMKYANPTGKPSKLSMVLIENTLLQFLPDPPECDKTEFVKKVMGDIKSAYDVHV